MLALSDEALAEKLAEYKVKMTAEVMEKNEKLQKEIEAL